MQGDDPYRKRLVIIILAVLLLILGLVALITFITRDTGTNQFGGRIKIQNYTQKVDNAPTDIRDATESYLYNIVKKNKEDSFEPSTIKDAVVRDNSDNQTFDDSLKVYSGDFIVDMESIKQSYWVQYSFSEEVNNTAVGGNPIVISCLPEDKLKYGAFDCKDFVSAQSSANDVLLQYLPYQNFSFKISPDATIDKDKLTLVVTFSIPEIDLRGDQTSRALTVAQYKKMVTDWIKTKGADPDHYLFTYNYDDNGNVIEETNLSGYND
jgi:uncharacterized protein YxeA